MPVPEPEGVLWGLVKPLSGWPETDEDVIRYSLAGGWRDGSVAFETASDFDPAPLEAAWQGQAAIAYRTRVADTVRAAGEIRNSMAGFATHADQLADKVGRAKEAIRTLMSAGAELAEGSGYLFAAGPAGPGIWSAFGVPLLASLVPRLAGEVNDILDRTSASVAVVLPEPGNGTQPERNGDGGGQFGSDSNTLDQELTEPPYDAAAALANVATPDAAKYLAHYLDGTGTTMDVNPDQVFSAVPTLQRQVDGQLDQQLRAVAAQADAEGRYGQPIPFSSEWQPFDITPELDPNWHLAIGDLNHSVTGVATVHPPSTPGGPPQVEVTYQTHIRDRYDFEANMPGKQVVIGGVPIPFTQDSFISQFHRAGTAQDFSTIGESAPHTETREVR